MHTNNETDSSPIVREVIGNSDDVPEGTKKMFEVRGRKILVINDGGKFMAINGLCPHYNASLENGVYSNGRIRCPLHGACFNTTTGDIEDYPSFDSIHAYQIANINGELVISTPEKQLESDRRTKKAKISKFSDHPIVVIGSGPAAATFIENIRLRGFGTPIVLVTEEQLPPYDRVKLSKFLAVDGESIRFRSDSFYEENNIQLVLNTRVTFVDTNRRQVALSTGGSLTYSRLVIATGGAVRKLDIPGKHLKNVHYLRVVSDANAIASNTAGKHVVCIGASFIGLEVAACLIQTAASVTVISRTSEPLPVFGEDVGREVRKKFEACGVKIVRSSAVTQLLGQGSVSSARLSDGTILKADVVIAGIGVDPCTSFLKSSSILLDSRGFVVVDNEFKTNVDWVYAIGDVTTAPLPHWNIKSINIQHYATAQTHGQLLSYSMVGRAHPHHVNPFFWAVFFVGTPHVFGIRLSGCTEGHDEIITHGSVEEFNFIKYYMKNNQVVAVSSAASSPATIVFLELFTRKIRITREDVVKNMSDSWESYLQ